MEIRSLNSDDEILNETKKFIDTLDKSGKRANATVLCRKLEEIVWNKGKDSKDLEDILGILDDLILKDYRSDLVKEIKSGTHFYLSLIHI